MGSKKFTHYHLSSYNKNMHLYNHIHIDLCVYMYYIYIYTHTHTQYVLNEWLQNECTFMNTL